MQLVIKTFTGEQLILDVEQNDRIEDIKLQIEDKIGINSDKQNLIYLNQELRDGTTINDYPIKNGNSIYLLTITDNNMLIFINYGKDKIIPLEVDPTSSIGNIKTKIEEIKGFESDKQLLIFETNILQNDKKLENYSIEPKSNLFLIYPSRNGFVVFIQIMNKNNPKDIYKIFPLQVEGTDLVENLKKQIEDREKISINRQRLVFAGKLLQDGKTLMDCSIASYSPIKLILR